MQIKSFNRNFKIIIGIGMLLFGPFSMLTVAAADSPGLGSIVYQEDLKFAPDASCSTYVATHPNQGREKAFTVQFKPNEQLRLVAGFGEKLYGGDSLSKFMDVIRKEGYQVIGGINGDGYNINTGVPDGPMIHAGKLVAYPDPDTCVGVTAKGEVIIAPLQVGMYLKHSAAELKIDHFNKDLNIEGCYLFSADFADSTKNKSFSSYDVIAEIIAGKQAINNELTLKVVGIKDNARDTPIAPNQLVISVAKTASNQAKVDYLKSVKVGDVLIASFRDESGADSSWPLAREAIGSLSVILKDGAVVTRDTNIHPRTCLGLKPDGTVVLLVVDGRQPGYSNGLNLIDSASFLLQQGCVTAVNLDGGGSSTIAVRKPGDTAITILNRPSDGAERSDGNALILVANLAGDGNLANIHINPVKAMVLPGGRINFTARGSDRAYQPAALPGPLLWKSDEKIGSFRGDGLFKAEAVPGEGRVYVSVNGRTAAATVEVVQDVDFHFNSTSLTLKPGQNFNLNIMASRNGIPVICQDDQFVWTVSGGIGTIDANGFFKAARQSGITGTITATFGSKSCTIKVDVGKLPVVVADFENGCSGWVGKGARLPEGGVRISEETDADHVRFGRKSLKLEYNLTGGAPGIAGVYLGAVPGLTIDGYPTAIGMWVYGDGKGHWLRGQLRDGVGAPIELDYTTQKRGVDWTGWKYVEAPIPFGRVLPLQMDLPLRYIETDANHRTAGTLYIDNIRLIYGVSGDDVTPPDIASITPEPGSILKRYTNIRVQVKDGESGIDPDQIRFYINGQPQPDFIYNAIAGNIQWNTRGLVDGEHRLTLMFKDKAGNETVKSWNYVWDTGHVRIRQQIPAGTVLYAGGTYEYQLNLTNPNHGLRDVDLSFQYNPNQVELVTTETKGATTGLIPGDVLRGARILENTTAEGKIRFAADQIDAKADAVLLAKIRFRIKPLASGRIDLQPVKTLLNGNTFYVAGLSLPVTNRFNLTVKGITTGYPSEITVRDEAGKSVSGAALVIDGLKYQEYTDNNGKLNTSLLTGRPAGTVLTVQAVKEDLYSNPITVKVTEPLGTILPSQVTLSLLEDNKHTIGVNWKTNLSVATGRVQFVKAAGFSSFESAIDLIEVIATPQVLLTNYRNEWREIKTFSAAVKGLQPGVSYKYRVGENGAWSAIYTFNSEPSGSERGFKFYYVSDPQSGDELGFNAFYHTLSHACQTDPQGKFTVVCGDLVDGGFSGEQWEWLFREAREFATTIPLVPVIGNHEVMTGDETAQNFRNSFTLPPNGPAGLTEVCYAFDYGDAHFAVLDSEANLDPQLEWLKTEMRSTTKRWKVVLLHRGPYPSRYEGADIRAKAVPVFEKIGIDLVLAGHDHIYSRAILRQGRHVPKDSGIVYVNGGAAGVKFYDQDTASDYLDVTYDENKQVYAIVEVLPNRLIFKAYNIDGRIIDSFIINKLR